MTFSRFPGLRPPHQGDGGEEATGEYELTIQARGGCQFTICLNCHGLSARFAKNDLHQAVVGGVLAGHAACTDCHAWSHPSPAERSAP